MRTVVLALASRSGVAALLAVGLLASSVAAASGTDSADAEAPVEVPESAGLNACWDNIERVPFIDTVDLSAESKAAIDCIYHYGITKGTSAVIYSPAEPVIRLHMALFLTRVSKVLGLDLPAEATESFDDLESVSAEAKLAVAQLKEMGITTGYSPQMFGPGNNVERVHMAHFLVRMLRRTDMILPEPDEDSFEDTASLYPSARADISVMVELGIMELVTPDRFDPRAVVTREDMALFLARILEMAEIKPVNLELSLSSSRCWWVGRQRLRCGLENPTEALTRAC